MTAFWINIYPRCAKSQTLSWLNKDKNPLQRSGFCYNNVLLLHNETELKCSNIFNFKSLNKTSTTESKCFLFF